MCPSRHTRVHYGADRLLGVSGKGREAQDTERTARSFARTRHRAEQPAAAVCPQL